MKRLREQLGALGISAIVLLSAALAFSRLVLQPLEERGVRLLERVARKAPPVQPGADKVAAVYRFLEKEEEATDWLAKLHGIGAASGVQLRSASYRLQRTDARIVRYEIVLPASGSYAQIRDFVKRSLAEIPVLSLDQITLKREDKDSAIQAEMRLTLHMVKS